MKVPMGKPPPRRTLVASNKSLNMRKPFTTFTVGMLLVVVTWAYGQQESNKPKPASTSVQNSGAQKDPPSLGFNHLKDVSPIMDSDAWMEEQRLEKQLPGNQFVHDKRAMHEAALMNEFMEGFKNSKECNGITFYLKTDKKPDFAVHIMVSGHDDKTAGEQSWTWMLGYLNDPSPADKSGHGMGGMGIQSNAKLTARDVCLTVWDDVDLNHFKKPGGKIE